MACSVPKWIHVFVACVLFFITFYIMSPVGTQSVLGFICKEQGFPSDCNQKSATAEASRWGAVVSSISGVIMIATVGIWSAVGDRIGRRGTLIFPTFGILVYLGVFTSIFFVDEFAKHWRVVVAIGTVCMSLMGSFVISLLSIFGQLGDITESEPQLRGRLFALLEGVMGICGIVGAAASALNGTVDPKWLFVTCFALLAMLFLYSVFVFPETLDPALRAKPINWKRAHIIGSLLFCFMTKSTRKALDEDAVVLYRKRLETYYGGVLPDNVDIPLSSDGAEQMVSGVNCTISRVGSDEYGHEVAALEANGSIYNTLKAKPVAAAPQDESLTGALLAASDDDVVVSSDAAAPTLIKPHNSIFILSLSMSVSFLVIIAYASVKYPYLKDQFNVNPQEYAKILCVEYLSKGMGTFILVPLIRPFLTTPLHELRAMMVAFIVQGLFYFCMPLANSLPLITICFGGQAVASCFTFGFCRGLLTNQTSNALQGQIQGLTSAIEVITMVIGGVGGGVLYSQTNSSNPGLLFRTLAAGLVVAGLAPFLISDTPYEFNNRNPRKMPAVQAMQANIEKKQMAHEEVTIGDYLVADKEYIEDFAIISGQPVLVQPDEHSSIN